MKNSLIYLLLIAMLGTTACTDDFVDMNKDPLKASELNPKYVFTHSQLVYTSRRYSEWRTNLIMLSPFSGLTISSFSTGRGFSFNDEYNSALWNDAYKGEIKDIEDVLFRLSTEDQEINANLIAASRVMRVLYYLRLTDAYGDIPYSQAGKGYIDNIVLPQYDKQEDIYKHMITELSEANEQFDIENAVTYGDQDVMFNGDVAKWKRFTNSLKLRLGMRLSKVDAELAKSTVSSAISAGVMTSQDDVACIKHVEAGGEWGIHQNGTSNGFWAENGRQYPSEELMDMMKESKDPRMFQYFAKAWLNPGDSYLPVYRAPEDGFEPFKKEAELNEAWVDNIYYTGYPAGSSNDYNTLYFTKDITSDFENDDDRYEAVKGKSYQIGADGDIYEVYTKLNQNTIMERLAPTIVMSYAEVKFLLAEAALRNWGSSDAQTHYEDGIRAAMHTVPDFYNGHESTEEAMRLGGFNFDQGVEDYITNASIAWDASKGLELIATEKWKTFIADGYEAFAEWRRTGFPQSVKPMVDKTRLVNVYAKSNDVVDKSTVVETKEIEFHNGGDNEWFRPRRMMYPGQESAKNAENYESAVARLTEGDNYKSRVWWDAE
jgi:hypothetical protein